MNQDAAFWNKIAEKYARTPVADEAAYQKKLEMTRKLFTPEMVVLELGCGTGSTAIIHAPFVKHIRAIDVSSEMIRIAKGRAEAKEITSIAFECAAIDTLNVADESVDMVMAHSILHLLEDKEALISRVYKMLKPGGWFVSSTACLKDAMWFLKPVIPVMRLFGKAPMTVRFFTADQLVNSFIEAGFKIEHRWQPGKTKALFVVAKKV